MPVIYNAMMLLLCHCNDRALSQCLPFQAIAVVTNTSQQDHFVYAASQWEPMLQMIPEPGKLSISKEILLDGGMSP